MKSRTTLGKNTKTDSTEVCMNSRITFTKLPGNQSRGMIVVCFLEIPPIETVKCLRNNLDSQGVDIESNGRSFKFWTTNQHVSDMKIQLAKMAIHRSGYARFDDAFSEQEDADICFGCDS